MSVTVSGELTLELRGWRVEKIDTPKLGVSYVVLVSVDDGSRTRLYVGDTLKPNFTVRLEDVGDPRWVEREVVGAEQ